MIDFYTWTTPNGRKVSIMLEESGLEYVVHPVNISQNEQFSPEFLAVAPNNKIPAIVDQKGADGPISIFESGAILFYLAEKSGKFLPAAGKGRAKVLEWLFWQMGGVGPIIGQLGHFMTTAPEPVPYAIDRFIAESARLVKVLDIQLADNEFLAGDYSIADMATYPWLILALEPIKGAKADVVGEAANVTRWIEAMAAREGVTKGMLVPEIAN
jgi:GSH-dependent disulfide-bond oxidoreductase